MATTTAALVSYDDPSVMTEPLAIAGFLAGYTGPTRTSYTTDLQIFTNWCQDSRLVLLGVRRPHLELFARWMESQGRMPATVGRRLSTLSSFYRYCHVEGLLNGTRPPTCDGPESTTSPGPSGWIATSSALCWSKRGWDRRVTSRS